MAKDALGAHARDELGISETSTARPRSSRTSVGCKLFRRGCGALAVAFLSPWNWLVPLVSGGSLVFLALLGMIGARAGGADIVKATIRVTFWGALAMALTAGIGAALGTAV